MDNRQYEVLLIAADEPKHCCRAGQQRIYPDCEIGKKIAKASAFAAIERKVDPEPALFVSVCWFDGCAAM